MTGPEPNRPSVSNRAERALATRRRIMEAAHRLLSERGYARTTMDAVATEAGVAVQTVYFVFHTKRELLQAAYEFAVLGPDGIPPHLTDWWQSAEAEPDVAKAVAGLVDGSLVVYRRAAPLVCAVHRDEDARPAYEFNEELRKEGYKQMLAFLSRKHPLRDGLTQSKARDILLTLLGPHVFFVLTSELGWTEKEFGRWVAATILRELFGIDSHPASQRRPRQRAARR
jgi:AcrR family transcriptional regulator